MTRDRQASLKALQDQVEAVILARQDADTGLLPASTAITVHGDYTHAWVRDNVYSILAVWALALAWRPLDADRARSLEERVTQLMRGLLAAMMRQAHKVERFKHTQDPLDALHAKYDTRSGEPVVGDSEWGHLQIDATAVFVLFLAQMSAAGLAIVRTPGELSFVQNLVYYLANAWRTPDFGVWERGHKRNEGVAEVNASSVGMAKAALEAIDGFRLPGHRTAIHVQDDDIAHARNTLEGLLPRESASKETDAALLAIAGYPAFAVDDAGLAARSVGEIVSKLEGRYGCKRFLRDGHQTVLEHPHRLHYEPGELRQFEGIESEWPLFFTYLLVDAALRGDAAATADYRARLERLLQEHDGQRLLPELYYVPAESIEAERAQPHSQLREANANVPLVWAQSLYLVGVLLADGHLAPADLDPLNRRARTGADAAARLRVALLAEDELVQARLAAHGIRSETLAAAEPVHVHPSATLKAALTQLGRDDALGLSGRPADRLGSLATCRVFRLNGRSILFLPSFLNRPGFYLTLDNRLLVDEIAAEIAYVRRHWRRPGPPLLGLLVAQPMLDAAGADVLLGFLRSLGDATRADVGVDALAALACDVQTEAIDWIDSLPAPTQPSADGPEIEAALTWEEASTRPLTAGRVSALEDEPDDAALGAILLRSRNPYEQLEVLSLLWQRRGGDAPFPGGGSIRRLTEALYARAERRRMWGALRRAAALLDLCDDTLEDAVARIVAHGKRLSIGRTDASDAVISRPLGNAEIAARLHAQVPDDPRGCVLIQEITLLLATLLKASPGLFADTLTLRPWRLALLIVGWLAREHGLTPAEAHDHLLDLSPQAILGRLREVIAREQDLALDLFRLRRLPRGACRAGLVAADFPASDDPVLDAAIGGWHAWREITGVITRLPESFYVQVWQVLRHCRALVIGNALDPRNTLDSRLVLADTTPAEPAFARHVEDLLNKIQEPAYRQLSIEALASVAGICRANPALRIDGAIVVDVLLATAVAIGWNEHAGSSGELDERELPEAWHQAYRSEPHRVAHWIEKAFATLLAEPSAVGDEPEHVKETT